MVGNPCICARVRTGDMMKKGKILTCPVCQKEFYKSLSECKFSVHCSVQCYSITQSKNKVSVICDYCGKEHFRSPSYIKWQIIRKIKNHFCSISCGVKFRSPRGEKNPLWKGGISRAYLYGYHTTEYKKWHNDVFERDDFTCQLCRVRGTYLHAHHIKGFSKYPNLRFTLSNGITLCKNCHMEVHSNQCKNQNELQKKLNTEAMRDRGKRKKASRIKTYFPFGEMPVLKRLDMPVNIQIAL